MDSSFPAFTGYAKADRSNNGHWALEQWTSLTAFAAGHHISHNIFV